jgi:hypothetical protein
MGISSVLADGRVDERVDLDMLPVPKNADSMNFMFTAAELKSAAK